jgi:hypothetical protein
MRLFKIHFERITQNANKKQKMYKKKKLKISKIKFRAFDSG